MAKREKNNRSKGNIKRQNIKRHILKNSLCVEIFPIKNSNMVNILVTKNNQKVEAGKFYSNHIPSLLVMFENWSEDYIDLQIERSHQQK